MTKMRRFLPLALAVPLLIAAASCGGSSACACSYPAATTPALATQPAAGATDIASANAVPTLPPLQRARLGYPGGTFDVELALNGPERERGLSYRDGLPQSAGMLFDMGETIVPTFWMKGMRFPLDMVWIGDDKRVVSVTSDVPPQPGVADEQLVRYSPSAPARYVLELNAGAAARAALAPGVHLSFDLPSP